MPGLPLKPETPSIVFFKKSRISGRKSKHREEKKPRTSGNAENTETAEWVGNDFFFLSLSSLVSGTFLFLIVHRPPSFASGNGDTNLSFFSLLFLLYYWPSI